MVRINTMAHVPSTPDARMDELAEILARGVLRMAAKKRGFFSKNTLEVPTETRLTVPTSDRPEDCEVT